MNPSLRETMKEKVAALDEEGVLALVRQSLESGTDPLEIIAACEEGMRQVGEKYEQGVFYLSGLIMAGEIFRQVLELTQPALQEALKGDASGRVLIGTAHGDIHDIGKTIVHIALRSFGFQVEDLGVDVPPQRFVERALTWQPDVIGISGLITSSYESMRETVRLLRVATSRSIPIIIGGGMMNEQICRFVGADYWTNDALKGVRICEEIIRSKATGCSSG